MPPSKLMEDHGDAYFFWRDLGLRGATCVHVDAHLDVSNFKVPGHGLAEAPELNCANFLHRALRESIVEHLVWVVPPHLTKDLSLLEWTKDELHNWMHLSLADYSSLKAVENRVEGTLAGGRFTVCTTAGLPPISGPTLVDIDVDYYLGPQDEIWQSPFELHETLRHLQPAAITVAISVIGGYTPLHLRYLGELTMLAWEDLEQALHVAAHLDTGPPWAQAAQHALQAVEAGEDHFGPGWDRAVALDEAYRANAFDAAAFYFMRHQHERSRAWLERTEGELVQPGLYLEALMAMREQRQDRALEQFQRLLQGGLAVEPRNRGHLLEMAGRCQARSGQHSEAIESFRAALKLDSADAPVWRELARAQRASGDAPGAARSFRKAVSLAPEELATAHVRLELAELYLETGQPVLAKGELKALDRPDVPPELGLEAQRLALRMLRR